MPRTVNDVLFNPQVNNPDTEETRSKQEIKLEYLLQQGFTKDNIEMKTDLSPKAIKAIAKGKMYASIFNNKTISDLCDLVMVLNVSKDRKGRIELTDLAKQLANDNPDDEQKNFLTRLAGG